LFKLFQSMFESNHEAGSYPESLVEKAIERSVDRTDPWIRAVSGYKKKLRNPVICALDHAAAMVDRAPPPLLMDRSNYENDAKLRTFFISFADMQKVLNSDLNLTKFKAQQGNTSSTAFALLVMEKEEKTILGAELSGVIVMRDIPQIAVSFEEHRLIDVCDKEIDTRHKLKIRVYDHLLSLALKQIANLNAEHEKLERYRDILRSKLEMVQRAGFRFDKSADESLDAAGIEDYLKQIEVKLSDLGDDDRMLDVHLNVLTGVLSKPEEFFWVRQETLIVDRMGIKKAVPASDTLEVTFDVISDSEGLNMVAAPVALPLSELR
jgi:hypothetical protein